MELEERRHNDHIQTLPWGGEQGALKALLFQCGFQGWPAGRSFPGRLGLLSSSQMQELAGKALRESMTTAESVPETLPTRQASEESHVGRGPGAKMSALPRN